MREYRIYFGQKFHKQKDGYWVASKNGIPQAHRWVWINHYGEIPNGMIIHHIDADKDNNEIENLKMLSRADHMIEHCKDENEKSIRRNRMNEIRPLAHKWLRSEEGRKKQSKDAKDGWKTRKKIIKNCQECGKEILTTQSWTKYCSPACYMRNRRKQNSNCVEAKCPICDKIYLKEKYGKQKFCSISCGAKNSSLNRKKMDKNLIGG